MPNRVVSDSICYSDSMNNLSWFEQIAFLRLMTTADDYGCFDARVKVIKGRCFPLDNVTDKDISDALNHMNEYKMIVLYCVSDKPYGCFPNWSKYQRIRNSKHKFPPIENADCIISPRVAASCGELRRVAANGGNLPPNPIQSNPIQSNPIQSNHKANSPSSPFDRFWAAYPKKVGKGEAKKAFAKVKIPVDALIGAVERQKESKQWKDDNGRFIPNPSTWLNQGRWEDELDLQHTQYQRHGSEISETAKKAIQDALRDGGDC